MFAICDSLFLFPLLDVTSCTPCKPVTAAGHFLAVTRDEKISEGRVHRLQERKRSDSQMEKKNPCKTNTNKGPFAKSYFYKNNFKVHSSA